MCGPPSWSSLLSERRAHLVVHLQALLQLGVIALWRLFATRLCLLTSATAPVRATAACSTTLCFAPCRSGAVEYKYVIRAEHNTRWMPCDNLVLEVSRSGQPVLLPAAQLSRCCRLRWWLLPASHANAAAAAVTQIRSCSYAVQVHCTIQQQDLHRQAADTSHGIAFSPHNCSSMRHTCKRSPPAPSAPAPPPHQRLSTPAHQPAGLPSPLPPQVPTSIAQVSIEDNWFGTTHDIIIPGAQPAEQVQEPAKEQEAAEQEVPKAEAPKAEAIKAEVKAEVKAEPAVECEHPRPSAALALYAARCACRTLALLQLRCA